MDGIHDLGGREGFGAVEREDDEPAFHARWEAAVFAMLFATGRAGATGNGDRFRHAIERIDPRAYLDHGYYGRWLGGVETLLVEAGLVDQDAVTARARALGAGESDRIAARPAAEPDAVPPATDPTCHREDERAPRFAVGDPVRTARHGHGGHTRLPAYARDRRGTVVAAHGTWVFPDTHAHGAGEAPCPLYTVAFDGAELWGAEAEPGTSVHLDLFEPYLEAATP
jgi:nitrile hydratase